MSIRLKLLLGCFLLTMGTLTVGFFSQHAQRQIGGMAVQIYDDALLSSNALRSAQNQLIRLNSEFAKEFSTQPLRDKGMISPDRTEYLAADLSAILADLSTASAGAISPESHASIDAIRRRLTKIRAVGGRLTGRLLLSELNLADAELDSSVRIFSADAYNVRRDVGSLIDTSVERTWTAMAIAGCIAVLISFMLSRTILPVLRNALQIARSITEGNLKNKIVPRGGGEAAELLAALATMQDSLSRHFGQFETRVANQADDYDDRIATQNARFDAALSNMTQGLCMFDAKAHLVVYNRRFAEIFGEHPIGMTFSELRSDPSIGGMLDTGGEPTTTHSMDTRRVEVSRQLVLGGGVVYTFDDITDRHDASVRLSHLASHDSLTELPNRTRLIQRLKERLSDRTVLDDTAFICLDLQGFKFVNDTLGHPIGDGLLKAAAWRLALTIGPDDFVARIGGDEFAIIQCAKNQPGAAEELAQRIISELSVSFEIDDHPISIGASVGVVVAKDSTNMTDIGADLLMKRADLALLSAKSAGRNQYRFFEASMDEQIQRRRRTEIDLTAALERREFELHYQPFVNVAREEITGFEALVRWRHPERGMVSPAEFIPVAEESGLIEPIGLWVLETACREAATWPAAHSVSVNLSPVQFRSRGLLSDVARILKRTGLVPSRLQLEITENVVLHDTESVLEMLNGFRRLGIRIAMDDFGTGYSSLGYLSRFPFDKVKIDQSFVRDLGKRENIAVVRAVVGLSKAMGIAVIAEGVETRGQLDVLLAESCEEMQGYHFSRPRPAHELSDFVAQFHDKRGQRRIKTPAPAQAFEMALLETPAIA